ncbi:MAG: riboflavin synthase [Deltaproteobacteria bacterium]|nr:riboflavin synthase [Deltaproteobacteria bacterium]
MFTGLVQDVGTLSALSRSGNDAVFEIRTALDAATFQLGESIAVDGCCLTVTRLSHDTFTVELSAETLRRSHLGELKQGARVHLERALAVGDRLGGHFVQGHLDGVGRLVERRDEGACVVLRFSIPADLLPDLVEKGSIAVSGVSLTINQLTADGFEVMIIRHTQDKTGLAALAVGASVNIETDMLAKHVRRLLNWGGASAAGSDARLQTLLKDNGYLNE